MFWTKMLPAASVLLWLSWASFGVLAFPAESSWKESMAKFGSAEELLHHIESGEVQHVDCARLHANLSFQNAPLMKQALRKYLDRKAGQVTRISKGITCARVARMLKKMIRQRQICELIDEIDVEYSTAPGYKLNYDEISFDFFEAWNNTKLRPGFALQRVSGGAMPGIRVVMSVELQFAFNKKTVSLKEVDYIAIRSHAIFPEEKNHISPLWKLESLKIHARCRGSGQRIVVDKWSHINREMLHLPGDRDYEGQMAIVWGGGIAVSDWHEDKDAWAVGPVEDLGYYY
ncbi:putative enterotoxin [Ophiocordyceps camponoti-floridani]|uniref:Putative enterotoxin n=1 Tax=Ophiocordyceps camponoti-floridani TaxID=2030778 RepID=A0A8H4Q919_9HYPO|nr:putative enterotoxin [Ophiocordyceps camponoti-floridani]